MVLAAGVSAQPVDLVSFGTATFTVESEVTSAAYSQNASGLVFNNGFGLGDTLGGTFATQVWSNPAYEEFGIVMSLTRTNSNLAFSVEFFDESFNTIGRYSGSTTGASDTAFTYLPLTLDPSEPGTGIFSSVKGIQFTWDSAWEGDGAIGATLEKIVAKTQSSTLTPPVITSATSASAQVGTPFSYNILASSSPTSYGATDLPPGLSVDSATGAISGTPTQAGSFSVGISASNAAGIGTATLALNVSEPSTSTPSISSPAFPVAVVGQHFSYRIEASGDPTNYSAPNLPPGLGLNPDTGIISGTLNQTGTFSNVIITAANSSGVTTNNLTITVTPNEWMWRAPTLQGNTLLAAAMSTNAPHTIVAVGEIGTVLAKRGTNAWQRVRTEIASDIEDVIWAGTNFVIGGLDAAGQPRLLRSPDGTNWTRANFPPGLNPFDIGGTAAGGNRLAIINSAGRQYFSTNAATSWIGPTNNLPVANPDTNRGRTNYSALQANGRGTWVAGGSAGTLTTSTNNGAKWTKRTNDTADFGLIETDGRGFIAFGDKESGYVALRSTNGISWTNAYTALGTNAFSLHKIFGVEGRFLASLYNQQLLVSTNSGGSWLTDTSLTNLDFDLSLVETAVARTNAGGGRIHAFGGAGLVFSFGGTSPAVELQSLPFVGANPPMFFTAAGANGAFIAVDSQSGGQAVYSSNSLVFERVSEMPSAVAARGNYDFNSANFPSGFVGARYVHESSEVQIEKSIDGAEWQADEATGPLLLPVAEGAFASVTDIAAGDSGKIVLLVATRQNNDYEIALHAYNGSQWVSPGGPDLSFLGTGPWDSVRPQLQWDGEQFLLLTPRGILHASTDGQLWEARPELPPLPTDAYNPEQQQAIYAFASDGAGTIVARAGQLGEDGSYISTGGPDMFYVLGPEEEEWQLIQPPASPLDYYEGCNVVWNGAVFASANSAGMLRTSPDGFNWTRRELGADVKVLTWTGTQFVGLTEYSSVITHPLASSEASKLRPIVTWGTPSAITYGVALSGAQLNATANATGTFAYLPTNGTVLDAGIRSLTAVFTADDTNNYISPLTNTVNLVIHKASQTIPAFPATNNVPFGTVLTFTNTNSSADRPVSFAVVSGPGTITNFNQLRVAGASGSITVRATVASNANYNAASLTNTFAVTKATPVISNWPEASAITFGQALSNSLLTNGVASVAGGFGWAAPTNRPQAGTNNFHVVFTPSAANLSNFHRVTNQIALVVNKAMVPITWSNLSPITYGTALGTNQLRATTPLQSTLRGTFTYSPASGTVLDVGTNQLVATYEHTNANYHSPALRTNTLVVNRATPTIVASNWPTASAITFGQALSNSTLSGGKALMGGNTIPGEFVWTTLTNKPNAGTNFFSVTFLPTDTTNFNSVRTNVRVIVTKATPEISNWPTASAITFGQALSNSLLTNGVASVAGGFGWAAPTNRPQAGTNNFGVVFTPSAANLSNFHRVTNPIALVVNKALVPITWSNLKAITYGTALGTNQLRATTPLQSTLRGTFNYSPASGTVLDVGTNQLVATYTHTNANYHSPALRTNTLVVNRAAQNITFNPPLTNSFVLNGLIPLVASSSAGIPVTSFVSGNTNVVRIDGTNAVMVSRGTNIAITATNAGNANYLPAGVTKKITVR